VSSSSRLQILQMTQAHLDWWVWVLEFIDVIAHS
jgi:hypothetical protein